MSTADTHPHNRPAPEGEGGSPLEAVKSGGVDFPPKLFAPIALSAVANPALVTITMASRLCYGMADEDILPPALRKAPTRRRTPRAGIAFVSALTIGLVSTGGIEGLGEATSFLLACVPVVVNIAVLVLRGDRTDHRHFRTPTARPALGALTSPTLASPLTNQRSGVYVHVGVLLLAGIGLRAADKAVLTARGKSGPALT